VWLRRDYLHRTGHHTTEPACDHPPEQCPPNTTEETTDMPTDSPTETIRARKLTSGRMVNVDGRWETVTTVSTTRDGFVEFRTDRRDDTNLPFTYRLDDRLDALVA
jgi:hypothetical protein